MISYNDNYLNIRVHSENSCKVIPIEHEERIEANKKLRYENGQQKLQLQGAEEILASMKFR